MSCALGIEHKDGVFIGADSYVGNGCIFYKTHLPKVEKKDSFIIASVGDIRPFQIILSSFNIPHHPTDLPTFDYLCGSFMSAFRECLIAGGIKVDDSDGLGTEFLLGYKKELWNICIDFSLVKPSNHIIAIGAGAEVALGACAAMPELESEERIIKALTITSEYVNTVIGPFRVLKG